MIYKIILSLIAILWTVTNVGAQTISNNYESFAKYADKVVRGKVVAAKPLTFYRNGRNQPCGVYMEIEVNKSWRGGNENFLLYSANSDVYLSDNNKDQEYLIFAFKNKNYDPNKRVEDFVMCEGTNSVMKNVAQYEYFDNSGVQRMFPIKKEPSGLDEWMLVMQRKSNAVIPEVISRNTVQGDNRNIIEEMSLTEFTNEFFASLNESGGN